MIAVDSERSEKARPPKVLVNLAILTVRRLLPVYRDERPCGKRDGTSRLWTKGRPRSYFGLRGNGINPSRFGILTLGSDCASITSFGPMIPLRLRI